MKKGTRWMKQMFALLLAGALVGTSFDLSAWTVYAAENEEVESAQEEQPVEQYVEYYSPLEVYEVAEERLWSMNSATGNYEKYIDRVDLSEDAKKVYTALENSTDALIDPGNHLTREEVTYSGGSTYYTYYLGQTVRAASETERAEKNKEVMTAYAAFLRDHPEVFWLNGSVAVGTTISNGTYDVKLILRQVEKTTGQVKSDVRALDAYPDETGSTGASKIRATITARDQAVNTILNGMGSNLSDSEKVAYFNDWLTKNNYYNSTAASADPETRKSYLQAWECVSALSAAVPTGEGAAPSAICTTSPVCEGYAKAFKVLCDKVGIPCVLVSGTATSSSLSGAHMWNSVKVDGAWYGVDVTWNDPVVNGHESDSNSGFETDSYLLVGKNTVIGDRTFAASHEENNRVYSNGADFNNGPVISDTKYDSQVIDVPKVTPTITFSESYQPSRTWNGQPLSNPLETDLVLSGVAYSDLSFTWYRNSVNESNMLSSAPSAVGNYVLMVSVEENSNREAASAQMNVEITCKETKITVDDTYKSYTKTYGDGPFTLSGISNNVNAPMTYTSGNTAVVQVDENGKVTIVGAGSAVITVAVIETTNYKSATATIGVTVNKKNITVKVQDLNVVKGEALPAFSYTDSYKNELVNPDDSIGTITYKVYQSDSTTEVDISSGKIDTVGTYVIKGIPEGNGNYAVTCDNGTLTVCAQQGTITVTASDSERIKTFDNQVFRNLVRGTDYTTNTGTDAQFSYRAFSEGIVDESGTYINGMPTAAGTYVIRLYVPATSEYTAATAYTRVTIEPFDIQAQGNVEKTTLAFNKDGFVYDENTHSISGITLKVKFGADNEYTIPTNNYDVSGNVWKNAGAYTLAITTKGNFRGVISDTYTVARADGVNPPNTAMNDVAYDKKGKTVADVALPENWSWAEADATKLLQVGVGVTATAIYKQDSNNYKTVAVTITMKECVHTGGTATCSKQAVCDRCHQSYGGKNTSNHVGSKVTGQKEATCTENGYSGDTVCTGCGAVLSKGKSSAALGHSYTDSITREPTTEQEGVRTYTCSVCGHTYEESIEKLPKEMGLTDGTWKLDGGKWWYATADGSYPSNGWTLIEGEWYAFDASGYMQTGWYQSGNRWYYLNSIGVMQTGWLADGGNWYYMNESGAMVTGWVQDGEDWYYMDSNGAMVTGWVQSGGTWYYLKSSGAMATGWQQDGGAWYYFSDVGAMQTGWQKIGDIWYYFYGSGAMAADTTIDGYRLSSSGAMY